MHKSGARIVALIVGIGYPLFSIAAILLALSRDPGYPQLLWDNSFTKPRPQVAAGPENSSGLSDFEFKHGIGPIKKELKVGAIDEELAQKGQRLFKIKCSACHKLDERYVGPALRGVTSFRSPTYIMNMILNPNEMVQKHPVAKGLLAQYLTFMSPQGLDEEKARAVLEYLRWDFEQSLK
jgi:mono/diheme cytochrome c family protein